MSTCPLLDKTDLYGLGVRTGHYSQWLCTILTLTLMHDPEKRSGMRNVNYAFAFAEWMTMVNNNHTILPSDGVVVVFLFLGTLTLLAAMETFDRMRPAVARQNDPPRGKGGELARLVLLGGLLLWVAWWWFEGIYRTLANDCGRYVVYFDEPVGVFGRYRIIGQVWSAVLLLAVLPVFGELMAFLRQSWNQWWALRRDPYAFVMKLEALGQTLAAAPTDPLTIEFWEAVFASSQAPENIPSGTIDSPETKQRRGLVCAILLGIVAFLIIIFLEFTLVYGNVGKLEGVSDTIPLVVGCGDMLMVLWQLKQQRQKERVKLAQDPINYRYPKTFLYDAEFPLIKGLKNTWLRMTGRGDQVIS